jgi:hypothetical protein
MHNFSAPGAQTPVCSTGTSRPTPPWHCKTDGCVSTSNPETWLALDFSHQNITLPAACNSNKTWSGRCHYVDQPTGIAVQRKGSLLLVSHAYSSIPAIKIFAKRTGASRGILAPLAGRPGALALAADEDSVWTILRGEGGGGGIARYALNGVSTAAAAAAGAGHRQRDRHSLRAGRPAGHGRALGGGAPISGIYDAALTMRRARHLLATAPQ